MGLKKIEEAFISEGYASIPFSFNAAGHPLIKAKLFNNVEANFLLDTGASINLLDYEFAKELGLTQTPTGEKGGGAGGLNYDIFNVGKISLEASEQHFRFDSLFFNGLLFNKRSFNIKRSHRRDPGHFRLWLFQNDKMFY